MAAKKSYSRTAISGVAGASGGTGLLGLASLIPETHHTLKQIAVYIAPTATVVISGFWAWLTVVLTTWARRWQVNRALAAARKLRDEIFRNPNSSKDHKKTTQENVEKLEKIAMELIDDDTEAVRASLAGNTRNPE